eukprot:1160938-Pelagomonas_calceolata.AAC.27
MIIKALSKSPLGAGLVDTDIGSDDRLAQHDLNIPAHASNRIVPPYLFPRYFPKRSRLTSICPDVILQYIYQLMTTYNAKPTPSSSSSSSSSSSYHMLCSRHSTPHRSNTTTHIR